MSKEDSGGLREVLAFCRSAGISISASGADILVAEAESPEQAQQIAHQLRAFGFEPVYDPIQNEDDANAGLLTLSRNPAAARSRRDELVASTDISRRPVGERVAPAFEAAFAVYFLWAGATGPSWKSWSTTAGAIFLIVFLFDAVRTWGWSLEIEPQELRVRRYFRWAAIPWMQIRGAEARRAWGRGREAVTLTLTSGEALRVGTFGYIFARTLRDRVRSEIIRRGSGGK